AEKLLEHGGGELGETHAGRDQEAGEAAEIGGGRRAGAEAGHAIGRTREEHGGVRGGHDAPAKSPSCPTGPPPFASMSLWTTSLQTELPIRAVHFVFVRAAEKS